MPVQPVPVGAMPMAPPEMRQMAHNATAKHGGALALLADSLVEVARLLTCCPFILPCYVTDRHRSS